ncbi:hypothetical protein KEJ51_03480 [Candidatus Bathyarchaeota archaeon]|nr:hypothetical protein [Candidatus Bathyarchaeota archaeon]MBS7628973.1 hypothetical protein [Candidatus Bathyarchaeota archaeon]
MVSNNIGRTCGECSIFSKCKGGFCPKTEVEVSRTHPACQFFSDNHGSRNSYRRVSANTPSQGNGLGLHARSYVDPGECGGPDPEYCTVYCPKYWGCKLVLEEIKKK